MKNLKNFWESLNPKLRKYIKSFLKKMAIMLDIVFIFIGFIKMMFAVMELEHWIIAMFWLLFTLTFIAIAWIYAEPHL